MLFTRIVPMPTGMPSIVLYSLFINTVLFLFLFHALLNIDALCSINDRGTISVWLWFSILRLWFCSVHEAAVSTIVLVISVPVHMIGQVLIGLPTLSTWIFTTCTKLLFVNSVAPWTVIISVMNVTVVVQWHADNCGDLGGWRLSTAEDMRR